MNNKLFIIFFTLCSLTQFACSNTNHAKTFTPITTNNEKAVVYIYRPTAITNAIYSPNLLVNKELEFNLKIGKKYLLNISPGNTIFEIGPDENYTGITQIELSLKPNKRYYLRIDTTLKINNSVSYEPYQRGFSLVEIDEKSAITEIAACCTQIPNNIIKNSKTDSAPKNDNSGDRFSVDKTQNPFSR